MTVHAILPRAAAIAVACIALTGCGGDVDGAPAHLTFVSADIACDALALPGDSSSLVGLSATGTDGNAVHPDESRYFWTSSDESVVTVKSLGSTAVVTCHGDWFDTVTDASIGHEPTAVITAGYGDWEAPDVSADLSVSCVIDAAGRWRVEIDVLGGQDLVLEQRGRNVSYAGTDTQASGVIQGNGFTLDQQGFVLEGSFTSRSAAAGTFTGPAGIAGTWSAHRPR